MKAKKLLAILASLCMLLTMVPFIAVAAEAELPAAIEGAPNYAALSAVEKYQNSSAPLPVVDEEAGTITLGATASGTSRAEFDLTGLTAEDDYVINFSVGSFANWYSTTWGIQIAMDSKNGSVANAQHFVFAGSDKHSFTDSTGTAVLPFTKALYNTQNFNIYVDADAEAGTRTYHVFIGGKFVYSTEPQPAIEPQLAFVGSRGGSNTWTVSNVYVYKVGEEPAPILPTKPEGNADLVLAKQTTLSTAGKVITIDMYDSETNSIPAFKAQNGAVSFVATPDARYISDNYVVGGNVWLDAGWNGSIAALTVADGAVLHVVESTGEVKINDTVVGTAAGLTSGDGVNFMAHVNGTTVNFFIDGLYVGKVEDVTANKALKIGTSTTQWDDLIAMSNFTMYNVEADPEVKTVPAKDDANKDWVKEDSTTLTALGDGMSLDLFDKTTGSHPNIALKSGYVSMTATPFSGALSDEFVAKFTGKIGGGWESNGMILVIGDATMKLVKEEGLYVGETLIADNNTQINGKDPRTWAVNNAAGVEFAAHVYPNAEDNSLRDVDWFFAGYYVGTTTGIAAPTSVEMRTVTQGYGDNVTFSNFSVYNVNGEDPELKILPSKPESNVNIVTSNMATVDGATLDGTSAVLPITNNVALTVVPFGGLLTENYVVSAKVKVADGWDATVVALTVADNAVLKLTKNRETNGDVLINDEVVLSGKRVALVNGGVVIAAYVKGTTVDFYVDGVYVGTLTDITPNKMMKVGTTAAGWGDSLELSDLAFYNIDADGEVKVIPSKPEDNKNFVNGDNASFLGNGVYDAETNSVPTFEVHGNSFLSTSLKGGYISDNYVVSGSILLSAGWEDTVAALVVADNATLYFVEKTGEVKINDQVVFQSSKNAITTGDGAQLAAHVKADGNGTYTVNFYLDGAFVGAVTEVAKVSKNIKIGASYGQWGDYMTITDPMLYNVEADPEVKELPTIPETNVNWIADAGTVVTGTNANAALFDKATGSLPTISLASGWSGITLTPAKGALTDEYIVKATIKVGGGWETDGGILWIAEDAQLILYKGSKDVDSSAAGGQLYINDTKVAEGEMREQFVNGAGAEFAAHVYPSATEGKSDVDFYLNGAYVGTVKAITDTKSFTVRNVKQSWGCWVEFKNIAAYNVGEDQEMPDAQVTVEENVFGGTATGSATVPYGTEVTITATPKSDKYTFAGWMLNGNATYVSTDATYTFTASGIMNFEAVFVTTLPEQGDKNSLFVGADAALGHDKEAEGGAPATFDAETNTITLTGSGYGASFAKLELSGFNGANFVVEFDHAGISYSSSWGLILSMQDGSYIKLMNNANGITYVSADQVEFNTGVQIYNRGEKHYALYFIAAENGTYDIALFMDGTQVLGLSDQPAPGTLKFSQGGQHSGYAPTVKNLNVFSEGDEEKVAIEVVGTVTGGTATGPSIALTGKTATLTATPDVGYAFVGWLKDDGTEYVSKNAIYTFTVTDSAKYTPVFAEGYTVSIGWTSVPYTIEGINGIDPTQQFTTPKTFGAFEGTRVVITMILEEKHEAHFKNADNGWGTLQLNNPVYVIESLDKNWNIILQPDTRPYVTFETEGQGTVNKTTGYLGAYNLITATPAQDWLFSHYEVTVGDGETVKYYSNPMENPGRNGQTLTIKACFIEGTGKVIRIADVEGGAGTVNEAQVAAARYGAVVTLNAVAEEGYEFAYWKIGNRIYTDATMDWTVKSDLVVTPVFRPAGGGEPVINFMSADGRLIATMTASELFAEDAVLPEVPFRYGYTNGEWAFSMDDGVEGDMNVYPTYTKAETLYTIAVEGGTASADSVQYETKVTVTADIEGFVAWVDEDGNVLSTDAEYTFFATRDITLTAVTEIVDETPSYSVVINPTSNNTAIDDDKYVATFTGEAAFSSEYRLIECGFVYVNAHVTEANINRLVIDGRVGTRLVRTVRSSQTEAGQFIYNLKNTPKSATVTARSFMVLENIATGEQITVYSGLCDGSWAD